MTEHGRTQAELTEFCKEHAENYVECYLPSWAMDDWSEADTNFLAVYLKEAIKRWSENVEVKGEQAEYRQAQLAKCITFMKNLSECSLGHAGDAEELLKELGIE